LLAFFTALAAFTLLFAWLLALRTRLGRVADEVEELEISAATSDARSMEAPRPGLAT
jgi:hypothetical protein